MGDNTYNGAYISAPINLFRYKNTKNVDLSSMYPMQYSIRFDCNMYEHEWKKIPYYKWG